MQNAEQHTYKAGDRVELHPATDAWMQGDRFGEIVKVAGRNAEIRMDRSQRILVVALANIGGKV